MDRRASLRLLTGFGTWALLDKVLPSAPQTASAPAIHIATSIPDEVSPVARMLSGGKDLMTRVLTGNIREVSAHCHHGLGKPTCNGSCPDRRVARVEFIGAEFNDKNGDGKLDYLSTNPAAGERFVTSGASENGIMVKFWGCGQYITSPYGENKAGNIRKLVVAVGSNGLAVDTETKRPYVDVIVDGPIEDDAWEEGVDKVTGQRMPLPVVKFQFSAWDGAFSRMMIDPKNGLPVAYEGCAFLCPVGIEPTIARYYIGQPTNIDSVSRRGLVWNPDGMAQPTYNPKPAILTANLI